MGDEQFKVVYRYQSKNDNVVAVQQGKRQFLVDMKQMPQQQGFFDRIIPALIPVVRDTVRDGANTLINRLFN
jgi:hypothetical protein